MSPRINWASSITLLIGEDLALAPLELVDDLPAVPACDRVKRSALSGVRGSIMATRSVGHMRLTNSERPWRNGIVICGALSTW